MSRDSGAEEAVVCEYCGITLEAACAPALIVGKEIHANAVCMMPPRVVARI